MAKAVKEAVRELLRVESSIIGAAKDAAIGGDEGVDGFDLLVGYWH